MLLVRRRAPEGSYFADGDRASGIFGVLATGFAVLLGLVVVLAFTSYDESKSGADAEALLTRQLFETAQFMPEREKERLCRRRRLLQPLRRVRRMAPDGEGHA